MKTAARVGIGCKPLPLIINLPRISQVGIQIVLILVRIDKLLAGVIWRIDVNHLDLAEVRLLEQFQHLQVITLNEEVFRSVEVHAFITGGLERCDTGGLNDLHALGLARPVQAVAFLARLNPVAQHTPQLLKVDPVLGEHLREQPLQPRALFCRHIH